MRSNGSELPEPPGERVDVGGYRLHVRRLGRGRPVAVLDSGLGGNSCLWSNALPEMAALGTVCAIDRAGYAWSDPGVGSLPRSSSVMVEEHRRALLAMSLPPPYVLVGHSFGAINVLVWARSYPEEVTGLILVDPSHPEMMDRIDAVPDSASMARGYRVMTAMARLGVMRLIGPALMRKALGIARGDLAEPERAAFDAIYRSARDYAAALREAEAGAESFAAASTGAGELGDLPLMVLTADWWTSGRPRALKQGMRQLRAEMLTWSSRASERVVEGCGHGDLPIRRPEALGDALDWVLRRSGAESPVR